MNIRYVLFALVAVMYPFGEYLQNYQTAITPRFIRFHLSDFGFVPYHCLKAGLLWAFIDKFKPGGLIPWLKLGMITALGLALFAEFTSRTDWIDVVSYFLGFGIGIFLLGKTPGKPLPKNGSIPVRFKGKTRVNRKTKKQPRQA